MCGITRVSIADDHIDIGIYGSVFEEEHWQVAGKIHNSLKASESLRPAYVENAIVLDAETVGIIHVFVDLEQLDMQDASMALDIIFKALLGT